MGLWGGRKPERVVVGKGSRRGDRYVATNVRCMLGDVVDVSSTGMRVRGKGAPPTTTSQVVHLNVCTDGQKVNCAARVVWSRRVGLRGYEVGLEFVNTSRGARAAIVQFARYGFVGSTNQEMDEGFAGVEGAAAGAATVGNGAGKANGGKDPARPPAHATVEIENLYAILGVKPTASEDEVRSAYRAIARECHPDVAKSPEAAERFALISKAYSVLRDPDTRKRYDMMLGLTKAA